MNKTELFSSMVEYQGGNKAKRTAGLLVQHAGNEKYPAVVVIQEVFGLVDHIKDVATRLAGEGYVTLAPDLFEGRTAIELEEARKIRSEFSEDKIIGDLIGAVAYLKAQSYVNPSKVGSIGFCMGGWLSLLLACHEKMSACVVFYGRNPSPIDMVKNVSCPILGNYGGADPGITEDDVKLLRETLTKHGKSFDIKVYPGAPHGFFNDTRSSYRSEAARDAWKRSHEYFSRLLKN